MNKIWLIVFLANCFLCHCANILAENATLLAGSACNGDIDTVYNELRSFKDFSSYSAGMLHILSALKFILQANTSAAILYHKQAKALNATLMPPLAALHVVEKKLCGGLGDIFYLSAVSIKRLVDTNNDVNEQLSSHKTMITLCSDTGVFNCAASHMQAALRLDPNDIALMLRSVLLMPPVYLSIYEIATTRLKQYQAVIRYLRYVHTYTNHPLTGPFKSKIPELLQLDEFALTPSFYMIYQGYSDALLLAMLHVMYRLSIPALQLAIISPLVLPVDIPMLDSQETAKVLTLGFVSSHFRKTHSICKLYCKVIQQLLCPPASTSTQPLHILLFSATNNGNEKEIMSKCPEGTNTTNTFEVVIVGNFLMTNRKLVVAKNVDIVVYLDYGLDPSTRIWASSRLAPIQMATWGHPSTTGLMDTIDYYISSEWYHKRGGISGHTTVGTTASASTITPTTTATTTISDDSILHAEILNTYHSLVTATTVTNSTDSFIIPMMQHGQNYWLTPLRALQLHTQKEFHNDYMLFTEQLVQLTSLGYRFEYPLLDSIVKDRKRHDTSAPVSLSSSNIPNVLQYIHIINSNQSSYMTLEQKNTLDPHLLLQFQRYQRLLIDRPLHFYQLLSDALSTDPGSKGPSTSVLLLKQLIQHKMAAITTSQPYPILLCPQHIPKLHPEFDILFYHLLTRIPNSVIVFLGDESKMPWIYRLQTRWRESFMRYSEQLYSVDEDVLRSTEGNHSHKVKVTALVARMQWLYKINTQQYLTLLAVGDVMLDPFPFGGGVTILESSAVCTPFVTYPMAQNVPQLAAGMLRSMQALYTTTSYEYKELSKLLVNSVEGYVAAVESLISQATDNQQQNSTTTTMSMRQVLCTSNYILYDNNSTATEWLDLFVNLMKQYSK